MNLDTVKHVYIAVHTAKQEEYLNQLYASTQNDGIKTLCEMSKMLLGAAKMKLKEALDGVTVNLDAPDNRNFEDLLPLLEGTLLKLV